MVYVLHDENTFDLNVNFPAPSAGRRSEPPWDGAGARLCCLQCAVDGSLEFAVELEGLVVSERQKLG